MSSEPGLPVASPRGKRPRIATYSVQPAGQEPANIEIIPAGISTEIVLPVRIKRRPGVPNLEQITVEGSFELQGQRFPIKAVQIPVQARSLVESKTEFDFDM